MMRWLLLFCLLLPAPAHASDGLDVKAWLSRPGVKLLAVEFYATWCKPCMEAVPRWKKLHEKYRDRGLRLVVVSVQDPDGTCVNPGWNPDDIVCDDEGHLSEAMKVGNNLPAAFLWSWRGNLLVRRGHVDDVARAVEAELSRLPRVTLDEDMDAELRPMLRAEMSQVGKVTVLADKAEREALAKIRKESYDLGFSDKTTCKVGEQLAANSLLKATRSRSGGRERLTLQLFSAETGCLSGSASVGWNPRRPEGSVAEAVAELTDSLRGSVEMPGGVRAADMVSKVKEGRIGKTVEEWSPAASTRVVVRFESTPAGAVVLADGELVCQSTPCSEELAPGPHSISMQAKNYVKRSETLAVKRGTKIAWELTPDFGWVTVMSEPSGLDVKIDDQPAGKTPLNRQEVSIGPHEVLVTSPCHYDAGERINVDRAESRTVNVSLSTREGAIDVSAEDNKGNALEAGVYVDGEKVGQTPGVFKVSICSKEIEVRSAEHGSYSAPLRVAERTTVPVEVKLESNSAVVLDVNVEPEGDSAQPGTASTRSSLCDKDPDCLEGNICDPLKHLCVQASMTLSEFEVSLLDKKFEKLQEKKSPLRTKSSRQMEELLTANPYYRNKAEIYFRLAEAYWEENHYQYLKARKKWMDAMDKFDEGLISEKPAEPEQDYSVSLKYWRKILREYPDYIRIDEVLFYLGRGALEMGKSGKDRQLQREGIKHLDNLTQNHPRSRRIPQALLRQGDYYFENRSLYFAQSKYETIINNHSNAAMYNYVLYKLAWVYYNLSEFDKAIDTFHKVIEMAKDLEREAGYLLRRRAMIDSALAYAEVPKDRDEAADYCEMEFRDSSVCARFKERLDLYLSHSSMD